ncbi:alpha/beta hydrolase, partial [Streptomyces sp. NPDC006906]|uniref:alpha/beta hydrolase n=1 Tax=Streptomyces sp. NPDC006906 TaxID=3154782 RepID=UPI0033F6A705
RVAARSLGSTPPRDAYPPPAPGTPRRGGAPRDAVTAVDRTVDAADGATFRCRVYAPGTDEGRLVTYLHGGGWALGDVDSHDQVCRIVAASLGAVVVSADYRRAPEFPYPTPLLDAVAAARWARCAFPGREHVLAGDSAGASLAIGVALDAREAGDPGFAAQLLLYPPVDPRLLFAAAGDHAEGYLLSVDDMAYHYDLYVPDLERRFDPAIDLLSADLRHLPPTVVATAEFDPLRDEGAELADKLAVAGVPVRHVPGPGLVHGYFLMQDIVPAAAARSRVVLQELHTVLRTTRPPAAGSYAETVGVE